MHIERQFRELEKIEEISAYNINKIDLFEHAPQFKKPEKIPLSNIISYVQSDVNMFIPIEGEEDYIVNILGWNILQRGNILSHARNVVKIKRSYGLVLFL